MAGFFSRWSSGSAEKIFDEANSAYQSGDYRKALSGYETLANQGYLQAQLLAGLAYYDGKGVAVDHEEAARYFKLAAEGGHPKAQFNVALMYQVGDGLPQDYAKALRWYRLSAQNGYPESQVNLGKMLQQGVGVDRDEAIAAWWVSLAAEQGDVNAQVSLANRYRNGVGVEQSLDSAYVWLAFAADGGDRQAAEYKAEWDKNLTPEELLYLQGLKQELNWKPQTSAESAMEVFRYAARQTTETLKQTMGEVAFGGLRTTLQKAPSIGQLMLEETHGFTLPKITSNMQARLAELEAQLDTRVNSTGSGTRNDLALSAKTTVWFIRRIDDTADVGSFLAATELVTNLEEYHLSLIAELEKDIDGETITMLLKRFSYRSGLRASKMTPLARLDMTLLPIQPW
jgi:TPR repeat protein